MALLKTTSEVMKLVASSAATLDISMEYTDLENAASGSPQVARPGIQHSKSSAAGTITVLSSPGASTTYRKLEEATIRNTASVTPVDVTVYTEISGPTNQEHVKMTLQPGETLEYTVGNGWYKLGGVPALLTNMDFTSLNPLSSDTYIPGSKLTIPTAIRAGALYKCRFGIAKTNAGTAAPVITVRVGTAGTTGDASKNTFTFAAGTAAADDGEFEVILEFLGVGASAQLGGMSTLKSALATTGLSNLTKHVVSSGGTTFDSTVANQFIGLSYNGGASAVHTINFAVAELELV